MSILRTYPGQLPFMTLDREVSEQYEKSLQSLYQNLASGLPTEYSGYSLRMGKQEEIIFNRQGKDVATLSKDGSLTIQDTNMRLPSFLNYVSAMINFRLKQADNQKGQVATIPTTNPNPNPQTPETTLPHQVEIG